MKKIGLGLIVCFLFIIFGLNSAGAGEAKPRVGIVQFAMEPNVELAKQGIVQALADEGFTDGENIELIYLNAQADFAMTPSIIQDLVRRKVDVITPLSTPCLQSAVQVASRNKDVTVVFTYVFDPYRVGAAKTPQDHLPNVTGVSCFPPVEKMLDAIHETFPERKKVGVVWNSSEANSEVVVIKLREYGSKLGLEIVEATVTSPAEVLEASRSLAKRGAQVFLCAGDNTLNVGFDSFVKVGNDNKIPVFTTDTELADRALIALGPDFHKTGYDGGKVISRVLKGEKTSDIPITQTEEIQFIVNMDVARKQGFAIGEDVVKKANRVIGAKGD